MISQRKRYGPVAANAIVSVSSLTKSYGDLTAVNGLDLEVDQGQLFAFLGPNGAGKSTTINCLTTLTTFDAGQVQVAGCQVGQDNAGVQRAIGVVFQNSVLDGTLTVRENLVTRAALYGLSGKAASQRIDRLARQIGLDEFINQRYATLSGGQRRRADIARALIHAPKVVFLDEPTGGLDPKGRELVWETVNTLRHDDGITVFLTTHYLAETEEADQVAVIDHGKLVANGTPSQLRA
ncbi:MAG: ABC transporter ATP-binding protein, partial [Micrococcales bacterium]|nr:ABC transporter ATP-binding protein [Micrococcales bacterium]